MFGYICKSLISDKTTTEGKGKSKHSFNVQRFHRIHKLELKKDNNLHKNMIKYSVELYLFEHTLVVEGDINRKSCKLVLSTVFDAAATARCNLSL